MRVCFYQPDIAPNVGAAMRLCACFGVALDVIEPCGFPVSDKSLKRAAMDYAAQVDSHVHASWEAYCAAKPAAARLVLLTTKAAQRFDRFSFSPSDILVLGRESAGVPDDVHARCDARVRVPLAPGARSLNVSHAAAIVLAEGLRQTGGFDALSVVP